MDERFIEMAMAEYGDTVLRVAASVTGNKADAEDVFSDVFFALYRQKYLVGTHDYLKAWLIRVTVNTAKNVRKSAWSKRRAALTESLADPEPNGSNDTLAALQQLKPRERAVIYLHYYEGYLFSEIARILNLREGAVRSAAARARTALKELLEEEKEEFKFYVQI